MKLFFNRIIWTCLPVMSNLKSSTTSNLWPFEFHISKLLPTFNMQFSNWSTWIGCHQFRIWNIIGYISHTLAGDRFNRDDIYTSEVLQAIKDRIEICFIQFLVSKNCNYMITCYFIMVKSPTTTHFCVQIYYVLLCSSATTCISTVEGTTWLKVSMWYY